MSSSAAGQAPRPFADTTIARIVSPRFVVVALLGAVILGVAAAIPTDIIENPWFTRMTPVYADQYFYWVATSLLAGALIATYFAGPGKGRAASGVGGGVFGYLAIGCPTCNKLIVLLLGLSGAMDYFAPLQPFLGAAGLLLVGLALVLRVRDIQRGSCEIPASASA